MTRLTLFEHDLVERTPLLAFARHAHALDINLQHHPLLDSKIASGFAAGKPALQCGQQARRLYFSEVAQQPGIHADNRHRCAIEQLHGAQHRSVAAETER